MLFIFYMFPITVIFVVSLHILCKPAIFSTDSKSEAMNGFKGDVIRLHCIVLLVCSCSKYQEMSKLSKLK